ncbi:DUF4190 domain-containing protein [Mycobacterium parascrofulaceum]|nr:DUF4190 domain-containing protein [Mycobacterium parascrofulaceum]
MSSGDPFAPPSGDPFAAYGVAPDDDAGPPTSYGGPQTEPSDGGRPDNASAPGDPFDFAPAPPPAARPPLNTYALLAPVFGVLAPPAGVVLGHLALPQIKRTGERGWLAAVCGLVVGYLLSVVLVALLIWLLARDGGAANGGRAASPAGAAPSTSVITSVAPRPMRPRHKITLDHATVGKCVEIEKRDSSGGVSDDEALDLFEVPCEHRVGVYTVTSRVPADAECNSTYVAAPPDRSFAVCLNRY